MATIVCHIDVALTTLHFIKENSQSCFYFCFISELFRYYCYFDFATKMSQTCSGCKQPIIGIHCQINNDRSGKLIKNILSTVCFIQHNVNRRIFSANNPNDFTHFSFRLDWMDLVFYVMDAWEK